MLNFINHDSSTSCALYAIFIYIATAYVIGSLFPLKNFRLPGLNIIKLILGMDVVTATGYLLGYSGLLTAKTLLIMLSLISFIGMFFLFLKHRPELKIKKPSLKKYAPLLISLSLLPLMLGRALCIPAGWDELAYQLAVPARWIQTGYLAVLNDNPYSAFPSAASVNFHILMMTGGILAPRLFVLSLWAISVISLYILIKPGFSKWGSSIMAFSFGSAFAVIMAATSAYSELFILVQVAGILLLFRNLASSRSACYVSGLAGFMAGMAASVKLTGLIVGAAFFTYILTMKFKNSGSSGIHSIGKIRISAILIYLLTFAFTLVIFYARPYFLTGNPLYPYFSWVFGNDISAIEMSRYHHLIGSVKYGVTGLSAFFTVPFLLAISPAAFDGGFGWQFLIIFLSCIFSAAIAIKSANARMIAYTSTAFIFYSFWFFTAQQSRFLIPSIFVLFILSKYALCNISRTARKYLILLVLLLTLMSIPLNIVKDCLLSWQTVLGSIKPTDYLYSATGPGYLKAVHIANTELPKNAKLMLLFENRGLYINKTYVVGTPFFQEEFFTPPEQITAP
ncbi:MAG: hypothetical protein NT118_13780, partial [Lentisphaerae bacterium]|nr:hypothetical protein [Lentisphaerota bacterium]